jgi:hypothetical protein
MRGYVLDLGEVIVMVAPFHPCELRLLAGDRFVEGVEAQRFFAGALAQARILLEERLPFRTWTCSVA